jgi:hypothetical protein
MSPESERIELLKARIQSLLEMANVQLEARRDLERELIMARRDVQSWRALYHKAADELEEHRRELERAVQNELPF